GIREAPIVIVLGHSARRHEYRRKAGNVHARKSLSAQIVRIHALNPQIFYSLVSLRRSMAIDGVAIVDPFFVHPNPKRLDEGRRENVSIFDHDMVVGTHPGPLKPWETARQDVG